MASVCFEQKPANEGDIPTFHPTKPSKSFLNQHAKPRSSFGFDRFLSQDGACVFGGALLWSDLRRYPACRSAAS